MVDLTVVIPVYNVEALLKRCLDSVCQQKTRYSFEIIVVDDGSSDDSCKIAESYENDTASPTIRTSSYDTLRYDNENHNLNVNPEGDAKRSLSNVNLKILKQKNQGPAKARNWGMKEAQGRYIALLDADDYWEDSYVEKTVGFLDEHPECVAVNVVCKNISVSGETFTPEAYRYDTLRYENDNENEKKSYENEKNIGIHNKRRNSPFIIDNFYSFWAKWCHVGTCSTTMKAEAAKATLMREDLRISEDYEFWLMVAGKGRWGMISEALYVSDGTSTIHSQEDWLNRMQRRWENAPALEIWESRIVDQYPELKVSESFRWAEGRVARNLAYCQLLSGRTSLARQEALKYGAWFVQDSIGKLMNLCKWTPWTWNLLCWMLRYREGHRFKV